ncbi:hypothetical protein Bpfe_005818, partial [Biomphalaria pfeifferi]
MTVFLKTNRLWWPDLKLLTCLCFIPHLVSVLWAWSWQCVFSLTTCTIGNS